MESDVAIRLLGACAVVALVLGGLQFGLRALSRQRLDGSGARLVHIVETTFLPNGSSVHALRILDRYVLVGRCAGHIALLADLPLEAVEGERIEPGAQPPG